MKNLILILSLMLVVSCQPKLFNKSLDSIPQNEAIRLNSLGYLPSAPKKASIVGENSKKFWLIDASTKKVAFNGNLSNAIYQSDVNQKIQTADFSEFTKEGKYLLVIDTISKSYPFEISKNAYQTALTTSMRSFYLWRCGTEVTGEYNGDVFHHDACHLQDGWLDYLGQKNIQKDGTGGWHDAGDFGKYTVNAGITLGVLFNAWNQFQEPLKTMNLTLPETAKGMPDYLKELKWETDFLFKMQYSDGSGRVSHKLTRVDFEPFKHPEFDTAKRYFTSWSSAATADFAAVMAMAARIFQPYDAAYADKCLQAAKVSYDFLRNNPKDELFVQGDFVTGDYITIDKDDRIWAAAEMWETTGDASYLKEYEASVAALDSATTINWDWRDVRNLGAYTYILSKKAGRNGSVTEKVKTSILSSADEIVAAAQKDVYARPLGDLYYWGCNGTVARQSMNLQMAYLLQPKAEYKNTIKDIVAHLFGRNYYGRSYVTGLGHQSPMFPHDRMSGADKVKNPWPGYLVGGGHTATGWQEIQKSYQTNEIAINWQSALVYALAASME